MHNQSNRTHQTQLTSASPADVLGAARAFFSRHTAIYTAYAAKEGPNYLTFRGQGGAETAIAAFPRRYACIAAPTVPEMSTSSPRFVPWLMPETTRSTLPSTSLPRASITLSEGVPSTA